MKLAIMQPYLFPYIGYFQLISAVDRFVIYDDVNFIKQGWINRNNILINGKAVLFTLPLKDISSFVKIKNTKIDTVKYGKWKNDFLKTIELAYKKAHCYNEIYILIDSILGKSHESIADLNKQGIISICDYLGFNTEIVPGSEKYNNDDLHGQERVIDICKKEKATGYVNAAGGKELYEKDTFRKYGIELSFINTLTFQYRQFGQEFVPHLSIIDLLMFNPKAESQRLITQYQLT
jgi:hypothetical protein